MMGFMGFSDSGKRRNRSRRRKGIAPLAALLLALSMIMAGCGCSDKSVKKPSGVSPDKSASKEEGGKKDDKSDDEEDVFVYSDAIESRAGTEGKLAVWFLRNDASSEIESSLPGGEATLVVSPDGVAMLIDFGANVANGGYVAHVMEKLGVKRLEYAVATTLHREHIGGAAAALRSVEVGRFITNSWDGANTDESLNYPYASFMNLVNVKSASVQKAARGDAFSLGSQVRVEIINPAGDYDLWKSDTHGSGNGAWGGALVLRVTYKASSFLIGGGIRQREEDGLISVYGDKLKCGVAKMTGYQVESGTPDGNTEAWAKALGAKIVVGEANSFNEDVEANYLVALEESTILNTAIDGTCLVTTSGDDVYDVQVERERESNALLPLYAEKGHLTVK